MSARLICQTGDLVGSEFIIEREATIGRRPDNDITIPSRIVSSHHARIYWDAQAGCFFLEDLNSYNGTRVGGLRITTSIPLDDQQTVSFANDHTFLFVLPVVADDLAETVLYDPFGPTVLADTTFSVPPRESSSTESSSSKTSSPPACGWLTPSVIDSILACENLVVRNLQVTQGYYRLAQGMRHVLGDLNVSWCAFATHASKTAGQALRHELMPGLLKSAMIRLAGFDNTYLFLDEVLGALPTPGLDLKKGRLADAMKEVSLLISEGNTMVFAELAGPFLDFINTFAHDRRYDGQKLHAFLSAHLRPGPLEGNGQDYLIEAFMCYYHARFEPNAKRKAEYVLQGNLLVGLHEQTRLQPQIEQALTVPLRLIGNRQGDRLPPAPGFTTKRLRAMVSRTTTQMLMSITLPSRELRLNEDVIAPTGVDSFPVDLLQIERPQCQVLVRRFENTSDTLTGSAADNWGSLDERMRFVVDFFRSHQQYQRLWEAPFTERQVPVIEAGHLPAGPL